MTVIWSSIEAESCFISREHYDCLPSMEFFSVIPYPGSDPAYLLKFYQKKIIAELFGSCLCHVALHNNCDMCINITFCLKFQTAPNQVRTEKYRNTSGDQRLWMSEKAIENVLLLHYISFHSILFFFRIIFWWYHPVTVVLHTAKIDIYLSVGAFCTAYADHWWMFID